MENSVDGLPDFNPPSDFKIYPEFIGAAPREVPDSVKHGRLARSRRWSLWMLLFAGKLCIILSPFDFIATLSLYFLPLGYLFWFGLALCAIGVITYRSASSLKQALKYVTDGEVAPAQVLGMQINPTLYVNGSPTSFVIFTQVLLRSPLNQQLVVRELRSGALSSSQPSAGRPKFKVGDYVAVTWLPGEFESTLQIIDYLEIIPDACLVRENKDASPWGAIAIVATVFFFFFSLGWMIYSLGRFEPIDGVGQMGLVMLTSAVLGIAVPIIWSVLSRRRERQLAARNQEAAATGDVVIVPTAKTGLFMGLLILAGSGLIGTACVMGFAMSANALLDHGPVEDEKPVLISEMVMVTHNYIFREYKIEYHFNNDQKKRSLLTTPQHIMQFRGNHGGAKIKRGYFGWRWISDLEPALDPQLLNNRQKARR